MIWFHTSKELGRWHSWAMKYSYSYKYSVAVANFHFFSHLFVDIQSNLRFLISWFFCIPLRATINELLTAASCDNWMKQHSRLTIRLTARCNRIEWLINYYTRANKRIKMLLLCSLMCSTINGRCQIGYNFYGHASIEHCDMARYRGSKVNEDRYHIWLEI